MKAAIFHGPGNIDIKEVASPDIGAEEVLIKVKYTGICGTDRHIVKGEAPAARPVIPGHEISGIVVKTGSMVDLKVDDRVAIDPNIFCGKCSYCHNGQINLCNKLEAIGVTQNGGFAEYVKAPAGNVYKLPDSISLQEGAMVEPVSCCLHGIDLIGIKAGDIVTVLGGGAIGLILAQLARAAGAREVIISEPNHKKRDLAQKIGFKNVYSPLTDNLKEKIQEISVTGSDIVIEAVGVENTVKDSFQLIKKGGTILFFGVCPENLKVPLSPFDIYEKELTIKGSYINPFVSERAINLMSDGIIKVEELITDVNTLEELPDILLSQETDNDSIKSIIELP